MASTYTTRVGLEKQGDGENANTWGLVLNENVIDLVDEAVAGYEAISLAGGGITLTNTDGVTNQARNFGLKFTGALPADTTVVVPAKEKIYYVHNSTTENYNVFLKPAGGTAVTVVEAGRSMIAAVDGTNINLLESTDPAIFATKVEVQALSATLATSINNSNTAIATLSATMATSISNTNSRIAATSLALATSINNRVAKAGDTMTGILNVGATPVVSVASTSKLNVFTSSVWGLDLQSTGNQVVQEFSTGVSASGPKYSGLIVQQLGTLSYSANAGSNPSVSATHQFSSNGLAPVRIGSTGIDVSGTVSATNFDGGGSNITNLNAANIASGVLATARLSGDYNINNTGTLDGFNSSDFLRVANESLSSDGYVELSNGLILQWGQQNTTSQTGSISFPTVFANACWMVQVTSNYTLDKFGSTVTGKSASSFNYRVGGNYVSGTDLYWFAIGE